MGSGRPGLERAEAFFATSVFGRHRHDTYAIGVTMTGVQSFHYRGERRVCLPGQVHILHPDEPHDGMPATTAGFGYRILYIEPSLVQEALGGADLPFVADPVQYRSPAAGQLASLLTDMEEPVDDLARADIITVVADGLRALDGGRPRLTATNFAGVERVREYLAAHPAERPAADTLEGLAGMDRFSLARHFRRAYGTSPGRYRIMRRLERARSSIAAGVSLAAAAAEAGFADQSHMSRQFMRAYGVSPGRWAALCRERRPS